MLARGRRLARERRFLAHFAFIESDINSWDAKTSTTSYRNQSLHHIVELELLSKKPIAACGIAIFLTNDMIGRNGHMRWPEALELSRLAAALDAKYKWNHELNVTKKYENWDCRGRDLKVRSQDILPLLVKRFSLIVFSAFRM